MPDRSGRTRRGRADDRKQRRTSVGGTSSHGCPTPRSCCVRSCHLLRRAPGLRGDRAVRVGPAGRRAASTRHARSPAGAGLLPAGGAGAALVSRRHPAGPVGRRQPDRSLDGLPVSARGHRRPRRGCTRVTRRAAGHPHVTVDGTLIRTDRCRAPGPTARANRPDARVDLWWSGNHAAHGGNGQVIAAPDGWPLWTSPVWPGREHDTTALRAHTEALPLLAEWTDTDHAVLADLGYEGERSALTTPIKHPPAAAG